MRRFLIVTLLLIFFTSCKKDPLLTTTTPFVQYYGMAGDETGRQVRVLSNGDIVVCGYVDVPSAGSDIFLLRTDHEGNLRWIQYYGGAGNETCWSFDVTADGGFVLGGYTNSFGAGQGDFYIVRTDADGNALWTKTYGGPYNDDATNIRALSNGFFICGISNNGHDDNSWALRLDANGDSLWSFISGGNNGDGAMASCDGPDGGHVLVGYTNSTLTGSMDGFLLMLNDSGQQTAYYNYGTPGYDEPHDVKPAIDGNGWVIMGHTGLASPISTHDVFLREIGNDGVEQWSRTYGGTNHDGGEAMCVSGQTYGLIGRSSSRENSGEDFYFAEVDVSGELIKESWIGSDADDAGYGIAAENGFFLLSGFSKGGPFGGKDIYLQRIEK